MPALALPSLATAKTIPAKTDVIIVGISGPADAKQLALDPETRKALDKAVGVDLESIARAIGAPTAIAKTAVTVGAKGQRIVLVGVGNDDPTPGDLRKAAGAATRAVGDLVGTGLSVTVMLPAGEPETAQAVTEGALLGTYTYQPISAASNGKPAPVGSITVVTGGRKEADLAAAQGVVIAGAVAQAREWINLPPNLLYPETFAEQAKEHARDTKITVDVLDDKALVKGGYGGIMAVGGGSSRLPRLVRYAYAPRGAKAHIALVGKGITFDSGGLNIKTGDGMYTMKCDMSGAAAVLAATRAIAALGLNVKVTAYASMAENLPSDTAYRPSDVLTMYGGLTVENGNCDAEGRLVMADALARATEDKPDVIIDVATLTGACMIALGEEISGLMSNDDELAEHILAASEAAGESFWPLPIPQNAKEKLSSTVADVKSTGPRYGGALFAAAFLREFVGDYSWAHLDIAGPAFREKGDDGHMGPGGTGVAVSTLVAFAASYAN